MRPKRLLLQCDNSAFTNLEEYMLEWDSKYEVGNERIDAEHRIFLKLIGELREALYKNATKERLVRLFNVIAKYAEFHFASEEDLMTECQYPEQTHHAYLHNVLLREVKDSFMRFQQDSLSSEDVSEFLLIWLNIAS